MAVEEQASGFGKRPIHRVWAERRAGEFVAYSQLRGWTAVAALLIASLVLLRAAFAVGVDRIWPASSSTWAATGPIAGAALLTIAGAATVWIALRVARSLLQPGPLLRFDSSRIVLRTSAGHLVLTWDDVELSPGRFLFKIAVRPGKRGKVPAAPADELFLPAALLRGGGRALRAAINRVRPETRICDARDHRLPVVAHSETPPLRPALSGPTSRERDGPL